MPRLRLLVLLMVPMLLLFVGCSQDAPPKKPGPKKVETVEVKKALPTRDELKAKLIGKTRDEVLAIMGKPQSTLGDGSAWRYENVSRDPIADRTDASFWVHFDREDKVSNAVAGL